MRISEILCIFAAHFQCAHMRNCVYARIYESKMKDKTIHSLFRLTAICCLLVVCSALGYAQQQAGTTVDKATRVSDTTMLAVQSGSNYIRIEPKHLPATIIYQPDTAFGTIPVALVMGDTIPATMVFSDCRMSWKWVLESGANSKIMEIKSHESASLLVQPLVCLESTEMVAEVWDSITWEGQTYTQSGDYTREFHDPNGCEYSHTLHLTVHYTLYDTLPMSACDSLIYQDKRYDQSGIYVTDTAALVSGDRQVNCIRLKIQRSSQSEQAVNQYDPFVSATGKKYTETGVYTDTVPNAAGCDSVITTRLKIYATAYDTVPQNVCDSFVDGNKKYTVSGFYTDTTVLATGDRTIRTLDLTVRHSTYSLLTISQHEPYTSGQGITYEESGEYVERITNIAGCDSTITLRITITKLDILYDTVYFCRGFNTVHEEKIADDRIRRYLPYVFESPATWDYMEGAIISGSHDRTLVDLKRVETNLENHYTKALTPVEHIAWSVREANNSVYTPIVATDQPQWIPTGGLILQIHFRCGELYNNEFPMAVEEVEAAKQPVKRIENGQIVIMYNGTKYNVHGQKIK